MAERFQFSIRFLLVAMVAVAAGTAAVRAEYSAISALATHWLHLLFATAAIFAVTQTNGKMRTFWIGTAALLVPLGFSAVYSSTYTLRYIGQEDFPPSGFGLSPEEVWPLWCAAPVNGLFAVLLHWLFKRRNPPA